MNPILLGACAGFVKAADAAPPSLETTPLYTAEMPGLGRLSAHTRSTDTFQPGAAGLRDALLGGIMDPGSMALTGGVRGALAGGAGGAGLGALIQMLRSGVVKNDKERPDIGKGALIGALAGAGLGGVGGAGYGYGAATGINTLTNAGARQVEQLAQAVPGIMQQALGEGIKNKLHSLLPGG